MVSPRAAPGWRTPRASRFPTRTIS